jgi:hypothetical protein
MLTAFMTACTPAAEWQSLGLYYSFLRCCILAVKITCMLKQQHHSCSTTHACSLSCRSGQPGRLVRIAACFKGEAEPTALVPTWTTTGVDYVDHIQYPLFNKAWAISEYMQRAQPQEEYVLILDSDMLLHSPLLPSEFGIAPGRAAAENMWYLEVTALPPLGYRAC